MRKVWIISGSFLLLSVQLAAQSNATKEGRIEVQPDRWEDKIVLELTNDMWLNMPSGVELRPFSPGFKAYFFTDYEFGSSSISFAWGFGVSADNVHSNAAWVQLPEGDGELGPQVLTPFPEGYAYKKNKFVTTYLELPLELRLITTGKTPFKLATGFRIGYLLSDHQKIIDGDGKRKFYNYNEIEKLRYGVSARVGVGKVCLTGFYSLTPLIRRSNGTDVVPISLGLAFTPIR